MLIVDMPMPKNCWLCNLAYFSDDYNDERGAYMIAICKADKDERTVDENETDRPSWCPIKGELVRCGECMFHSEPRRTDMGVNVVWCNFYNTHKIKDGYCNCGERKDGEG